MKMTKMVHCDLERESLTDQVGEGSAQCACNVYIGIRLVRGHLQIALAHWVNQLVSNINANIVKMLTRLVGKNVFETFDFLDTFFL